MTVSILICTIDAGILKVPSVLMSPNSDVSYVVSMQYTDSKFLQMIPQELTSREDVKVSIIQGKGLSRNRNNAMAQADGDILVLADDDNRYTLSNIETIVTAYKNHPKADVIHFQAQTLDGKPLHPYPADYVSSVEITFRKSVTWEFDERFGLGSEFLCAGEEAVFLKDLKEEGYKIIYIAKPIVQTAASTTGSNFLHNKQMQLSKGATFRYVYGTFNAIWRSIKEAGWYFVHQNANPFPILYNMCRGVFLF